MIQEATENGARLSPACKEAGIAVRTYRRWYQKENVQEDQRKLCDRPEPSNKLSAQERERIINVCNEEKFASLPVGQIVPSLLDDAIYLASESTCHRILKEANQASHRGRSAKARKHTLPTSYIATEAGQVWSWDITYLPSGTVGKYYYLYMMEDIYSRKVVAYEVHLKECGSLAATLLQ